MSLADKGATLAEGARQAMQTTGSIHGIVLSSPPASGMKGQDETHRTRVRGAAAMIGRSTVQGLLRPRPEWSFGSLVRGLW